MYPEGVKKDLDACHHDWGYFFLRQEHLAGQVAFTRVFYDCWHLTSKVATGNVLNDKDYLGCKVSLGNLQAV